MLQVQCSILCLEAQVQVRSFWMNSLNCSNYEVAVLVALSKILGTVDHSLGDMVTV